MPQPSDQPPGTAQAGRVYCFYNHNTDNVCEVIADKSWSPDGLCWRVGSLGHLVFKVSDDGGRSWSAQRDFEIDRGNPYGGSPITKDQSAVVLGDVSLEWGTQATQTVCVGDQDCDPCPRPLSRAPQGTLPRARLRAVSTKLDPRTSLRKLTLLYPFGTHKWRREAAKKGQQS